MDGSVPGGPPSSRARARTNSSVVNGATDNVEAEAHNARAVEVLDQPELDCTPDIIEMLPRDRVASFLSGMSADRVTDVIREIEEPGRSDLRARLDAETRGAVDKLTVEKVNGAPVLGPGPLETAVRESLLAGGFYSTPRGLRMRR